MSFFSYIKYTLDKMPVRTKIVSGVVNYTYEVDGPADHVLIPNGSYFKDLSNNLIYQKDNLGSTKTSYDQGLPTVGPNNGKYTGIAEAIAAGVEKMRVIENTSVPSSVTFITSDVEIQIDTGITLAFADGAHLIVTQAETKVHIFGGGSLTYLDTGYGLTFGGAKVDLTATTADVTVNAVLYSTTGEATIPAAAVALMNAVDADPLVRVYQDNPGVDAYFYAVPSTTTPITVVSGVDTATSPQAPTSKWTWYKNLSGNGNDSILKFTNVTVNNNGTGIFGGLIWLMESVALQLEDCHFIEANVIATSFPYGINPFHKYPTYIKGGRFTGLGTNTNLNISNILANNIIVEGTYSNVSIGHAKFIKIELDTSSTYSFTTISQLQLNPLSGSTISLNGVIDGTTISGGSAVPINVSSNATIVGCTISGDLIVAANTENAISIINTTCGAITCTNYPAMVLNGVQISSNSPTVIQMRGGSIDGLLISGSPSVTFDCMWSSIKSVRVKEEQTSVLIIGSDSTYEGIYLIHTTGDSTITTDVTNGSTTLTNISDADNAIFAVGRLISGVGIPIGSQVVTKNNEGGDANTIEISHPATATNIGVSLSLLVSTLLITNANNLISGQCYNMLIGRDIINPQGLSISKWKIANNVITNPVAVFNYIRYSDCALWHIIGMSSGNQYSSCDIRGIIEVTGDRHIFSNCLCQNTTITVSGNYHKFTGCLITGAASLTEGSGASRPNYCSYSGCTFDMIAGNITWTADPQDASSSLVVGCVIPAGTTNFANVHANSGMNTL